MPKEHTVKTNTLFQQHKRRLYTWTSPDSQYKNQIRSDQIRSVAQSCPTLCDPMNHSTPGLPVHHQLQKFTETHVHRVSDAIQPSHPLSSPSPPAPNPSQHQSFPMSQLIIFFAAKDGEALYSQQKQDQELTVAQIMNSFLPNSD